jgi:hypothetical protein
VYLTEEDETDSNVWMGLSNEVGIIGNTGDGIAFRTGASTATESARIDASGKVGIGMTPSKLLDIQATDNLALRFYNSTSFKAGLEVATTAGDMIAGSAVDDLAIRAQTNMLFATGGNTERARIDSSGNLLVGQTVGEVIGVGNTTEGISLGANGRIFASYNGQSAYLNRNGTDGALLGFYRGGTSVGKIGTYSGDLTIGNGSTVGLIFEQTGSDRISPWNLTANATRDGEIDLGDSNQRFKDLYLSAGVYLGGTGAANRLDDYETGTWTPVPKGSTTAGTISIPAGHATGTYVKVGELVHISMFLYGTNFTGAGTFEIHGLPFAHQGSSGTLPVQINNPPWDSLPADNQNITGYLTNTTIMTFRATNRTKAGGYITATVTSPSTIGYLRINGTYKTA